MYAINSLMQDYNVTSSLLAVLTQIAIFLHANIACQKENYYC